jgi:hypothetical protein
VDRSPDELQRRLAPGAGSVGHLVDRPVEQSDAAEPPEDVDAPVTPRHSRVGTDGEGDVASRFPQLVRQLHAGCRRPDHEHATGRQLRWASVPVGDDLDDAGVQLMGDSRYRRLVAPAGRDDHVGGPVAAAIGGDDEPVAVASHGPDTRVLLDRCGEGAGVVGEMSAELGGRHESVGIPAPVRPGGERVHPVRREQVERVPRVAVPPLADTAALQHHVVTAARGQAAAGGQAGLAGADDDGVDGGHRWFASRGPCRTTGRREQPAVRMGRAVRRPRRRSRPGPRWTRCRTRPTASATARPPCAAPRDRRPSG